MRNPFDFNPSPAYQAWLDEHIEGLIASHVNLWRILPKEAIQWEQVAYWNADNGGWYTTGDRWSSADWRGSTIYRRAYGNAVTYHAPQALIDEWIDLEWLMRVGEYGLVEAARQVLVNLGYGEGVIGGDVAVRLVQLKGLAYFVDIAKSETWVIWNPNYHPERPGWKPSEFAYEEAVICETYHLPFVQMWNSPASLNSFWGIYPSFKQHPDGSWWARKTYQRDQPDIFHRIPDAEVPEILLKSGGFYAPPIYPGYAAKRQRVADSYAIHPASLVWVPAESYEIEHLDPSVREVIRSAIADGEADVWAVWHQGKVPKLARHIGAVEYVYFDPYFSDESVLLDDLRYNPTLGLHSASW